ncbi:uncharacterized protein N7483_012663 [Penicillium malachiteum]|uniref:uncharacterized protein n=1 Tax=Penicillium malachiteum TaxID=1324776 RepID=UPI002549B580|nr:uncharacterized protein N7483_012663 [Penicillium malachiteum]KAJ5715482.1 hypothetical protein N7483_012663 [Penicillium malachiteum]
MPQTRRLLKEEITLSQAQEKEVNILRELDYYDQRREFISHLKPRWEWMGQVVAHHLGLPSPDDCVVAISGDWRWGSFNVSIPFIVKRWSKRAQSQPQKGNRVMLRFPLPYRVGDAFRPGNSDEKLQCEAGTYAWLQQNCPDVPIPQLYGFGLSTGETFTRLDRLLFHRRWFEYLRLFAFRCLSHISVLPNPATPSNYVINQFQPNPDVSWVDKSGYLVTEFIEESQGSMLSNTWFDKEHHTSERRSNYFHSLTRILLSISKTSLPSIGSFLIDRNGDLILGNRPLTMEIQELENESITTDIPRDSTFSTIQSYVADILQMHDNRLRDQPNAVNDRNDSEYQMTALAAMRTIEPLIFNRGLRRGPFIFSLTDMHQSNVFVDNEWNITCVIDLEWACSKPIEMVHPPYWLTDKGVDEIESEEYNIRREEFMTALRSEESKLENPQGRPYVHSEVMEQSWGSGALWYSLALTSPTGLFQIFYNHIHSLLSDNEDLKSKLWDVMPVYWVKDAEGFMSKKVDDKKLYDKNLIEAFSSSSSSSTK